MMVRFRFDCETSALSVGSAPKGSVGVMDRWSLAETGTGLASRALGIWTLRFAFLCSAGSSEFPTNRFAVAFGTRDETAVPSLGDKDARTDPTNDLSANGAVGLGESSKFRDNFDVWSLPFLALADGDFRARGTGSDVAADEKASWSGAPGDRSGTRLGSIRRFGGDAAPSPEG